MQYYVQPQTTNGKMCLAREFRKVRAEAGG